MCGGSGPEYMLSQNIDRKTSPRRGYGSLGLGDCQHRVTGLATKNPELGNPSTAFLSQPRPICKSSLHNQVEGVTVSNR